MSHRTRIKPQLNYADGFYNNQMEGSYRSASIVVPYFLNFYKPLSVVDLGCGRGTWLKAFKENGVDRGGGHDGHWNSREKMVDSSIEFNQINLNAPEFECHEKFGLAMSLEVAEHLDPSSASDFVRALTSLSDIVIFGAAYSHQGGVDHINEQPATYWAKLFNDCNYVPYDIFRPKIWGNPNIESWYQQNTFLYLNKSSKLNEDFRMHGLRPMENLEFMNCIHPQMYMHYVAAASSPLKTLFKGIASSIIPGFLKIRLRNIRQRVIG